MVRGKLRVARIYGGPTVVKSDALLISPGPGVSSPSADPRLRLPSVLMILVAKPSLEAFALSLVAERNLVLGAI